MALVLVGLLPKPRPSAQEVVNFVQAEAYKQRVRRFLATGRPGLPDPTLRYFVSP